MPGWVTQNLLLPSPQIYNSFPLGTGFIKSSQTTRGQSLPFLLPPELIPSGSLADIWITSPSLLYTRLPCSAHSDVTHQALLMTICSSDTRKALLSPKKDKSVRNVSGRDLGSNTLPCVYTVLVTPRVTCFGRLGLHQQLPRMEKNPRKGTRNEKGGREEER